MRKQLKIVAKHVHSHAGYSHKWCLHVLHKGHGCQCAHQMDLRIILGSTGSHYEERGGSLGVTEVAQLLVSCFLQNPIDHRWQIVHANLVPREAPVGLVRIGVEFYVALGVAIPPDITHPDVVSVGVEKVTQATFGTHYDPSGRGVLQSVNQQNWLGSRSSYAMKGKDIFIIGGHLVGLRWMLVLLQ